MGRAESQGVADLRDVLLGRVTALIVTLTGDVTDPPGATYKSGFQFDGTADGPALKLLNIIFEFTR